MAVDKKSTLPAAAPKTGGAMVVPDFMKDDIGKGTENIGSADVEIPRIKLLQAISPEVNDHDEARSGEFWHTIAERSIGRDVVIVPVYIDQRYMLWRPLTDGGGILARADDGVHWTPANASFDVKLKGKKNSVTWKTKPTVAESGLANWGSSDPDDENSQPAATKMLNVVCFLPDHPDLSPAVVTLQRSALKPGRKFLGKLKIVRAPSYGCLITMGSTVEQGSEGTYNNYKFTMDGFVDDPQLFNVCKEMYEMFKSQGVNIRDLEGAQSDSGSSTVNADADDAPF